MAYINREDALGLLNKNSITKKITLADGVSIYDSIENLPTADVVEVVLCKDCKRCDFYCPVKPIDEEAIGAYFCKVWERYTEPTVFCGFGERKQNGTL